MSVSGIYQYFFLGEFYTKSWEIGPWFFQHTFNTNNTLDINIFKETWEKRPYGFFYSIVTTQPSISHQYIQ